VPSPLIREGIHRPPGWDAPLLPGNAQQQAVQQMLNNMAAEVAEMDPRVMRKLMPALMDAKREVVAGLREFLADGVDNDKRYTAHDHRRVMLALDQAMNQVAQINPQFAKALEEMRVETGHLAMNHLKFEVARMSHVFGGPSGMATGGVQIDTAAVMLDAKKELIKRHRNSANRYVGNVRKDIRHQFAVGLARGETFHQMGVRLRKLGGPKGMVSLRGTAGEPGSFVEDIPEGLFRRYGHWAHRLVRTETMNAYNVQHAAGIDELNEGVDDDEDPFLKLWDSTLDSRICPICGPLNRVAVKPEDKFPGGYDHPPAHPYCRCVVVAWHPSWGNIKGEGAMAAPPKPKAKAKPKPKPKPEPKPKAKPKPKKKKKTTQADIDKARAEYERKQREREAKAKDKAKPTQADLDESKARTAKARQELEEQKARNAEARARLLEAQKKARAAKAEKDAAKKKAKPKAPKPKPKKKGEDTTEVLNGHLSKASTKQKLDEWPELNAARGAVERHLEGIGLARNAQRAAGTDSDQMMIPHGREARGPWLGKHALRTGGIYVKKKGVADAKRFAKAFQKDPKATRKAVEAGRQELENYKREAKALKKAEQEYMAARRAAATARGRGTNANATAEQKATHTKAQAEMERTKLAYDQKLGATRKLGGQVLKSPNYKMYQSLDGVHTVMHEAVHGYGPIDKKGMERQGLVVEEVTTEVLARREMVKLYGLNPEMYLDGGSYGKWVDGMTDEIGKIYGVDKPEARKLLEEASHGFKSEKTGLDHPATVTNRMAANLPERPGKPLSDEERQKFRVHIEHLARIRP
jgi:hypothetical protein